MQRIGIYEWSVSTELKGYRGIYRGNSALSALSVAPRLIEEFFRIAEDGCSTEFCASSFVTLQRVSLLLRRYNIKTDLLFFSDERSFSVKADSFVFIGYDICAKSAYYSPIGAGLHAKLLQEGLRWQRISDDEFNSFTLNENGLFSTFETARKFSDMCNDLQLAKEYEFESETDWRPVSIWALNA